MLDGRMRGYLYMWSLGEITRNNSEMVVES